MQGLIASELLYYTDSGIWPLFPPVLPLFRELRFL